MDDIELFSLREISNVFFWGEREKVPTWIVKKLIHTAKAAHYYKDKTLELQQQIEQLNNIILDMESR